MDNLLATDKLPSHFSGKRVRIKKLKNLEIQEKEMSENKTLLRLQNQEKPDQVVELYWDGDRGRFITRGLRHLFNVKEIFITPEDFLANLQEYASVLYWLLESMSTADDLNLPFAYQDEFTLRGKTYRLLDEGNYKQLTESTSLQEMGEVAEHGTDSRKS